jgi:hypothetical protein
MGAFGKKCFFFRKKNLLSLMRSLIAYAATWSVINLVFFILFQSQILVWPQIIYECKELYSAIGVGSVVCFCSAIMWYAIALCAFYNKFDTLACLFVIQFLVIGMFAGYESNIHIECENEYGVRLFSWQFFSLLISFAAVIVGACLMSVSIQELPVNDGEFQELQNEENNV